MSASRLLATVIVVAAVLALFCASISAVDRTKFRRCHELDFCKSHRDLKRSYSYTLDTKSFKVPA